MVMFPFHPFYCAFNGDHACSTWFCRVFEQKEQGTILKLVWRQQECQVYNSLNYNTISQISENLALIMTITLLCQNSGCGSNIFDYLISWFMRNG